MSIEAVKSFIERMKTDEEFAEKVTEQSDAAARMAYVKQLGFDSTDEEIREAKSVLNEQDLSEMAGGRTPNEELSFGNSQYTVPLNALFVV